MGPLQRNYGAHIHNMKLTRKDFYKIAEFISEEMECTVDKILLCRFVISNVDNSRFDKDKFISHCGLASYKEQI